MTNDLEPSTHFFFRGISARHSAVRLERLRNSDLDVCVIIPDLTVPGSLDNRLAYLRTFEDPTAPTEALTEQVRNQVKMGLVSLYYARFHCANLEVVLNAAPPLDRFEIFQNSLWLTLFSDVDTPSAIYPTAMRFGSQSVMYKTQRSEFVRLRNFRNVRKYSFHKHMTDSQFRELFRDATGETLSESEMDATRRAFRKFVDEFTKSAKLNSER